MTSSNLSCEVSVLTDLLDLLGIALIVAAAFVIAGTGAALIAAGACCLVVSYTMTRAKRGSQ